MIGAIFQYGSDTVEVRIVGTVVLFRTSQFQQFAEIDGLKLDRYGVMKEFPDLVDEKEWKKIAAQRFKDKIKKMETEKERMKYVIYDLTKFGYTPLYLQKQGFRPIKL